MIDNDTQFINKTLHNFYEHLKITHKVTSIEYPQVNNQIKAANKRTEDVRKKKEDRKLAPNWEGPFNPSATTHIA
ncbi:hypothetical protein CR513_17957, partial [Mucuna pruriens]